VISTEEENVEAEKIGETEEPVVSTEAVDEDLPPEYETRTLLSLHQMPPDTPWQVAYSHLFGSHVNWSQYPIVPARNRPLRPRQSVCPITGLPAIYKDPRSGIAYANKEAYQSLTRVMAGQHQWTGGPSTETEDAANQNYDPIAMGCYLDSTFEMGACNVLYRATSKEVPSVPSVPLYRPKGTIAPGDEQALVAAAKALPAGTTRSGGRRGGPA
jgi:vacuolar protein sorting-associated protein 72